MYLTHAVKNIVYSSHSAASTCGRDFTHWRMQSSTSNSPLFPSSPLFTTKGNYNHYFVFRRMFRRTSTHTHRGVQNRVDLCWNLNLKRTFLAWKIVWLVQKKKKKGRQKQPCSQCCDSCEHNWAQETSLLSQRARGHAWFTAAKSWRQSTPCSRRELFTSNAKKEEKKKKTQNPWGTLSTSGHNAECRCAMCPCSEKLWSVFC